MSGNAVKFGDGCATVTEYKLPSPPPGWFSQPTGRREQGKVRSQDIGRIVLVGPERLGALLRTEKDEASPSRLCGRDSSDAFILRFAVR